jgi:D-threo-aldose 1-dehydrogenase
MFRAVADDEAHDTVAAAWAAGVRFFDTAPVYGAGLAELRLGEVLAARPRDSYVLATKVGRIVLDEVRPRTEPPRMFAAGRPNAVVNDYTADATLRSIEDSLARLRTDRLDIVWVHDVAQNVYGDEWLDKLAECRTGAFRVLDRLRDEGTISAWGMATNPTEPIELVLALEQAHPDAFLLACSYTLLEHEHALQRLLPAADRAGVDMVIGGPYNSGVLAGGPNFDYAAAPASVHRRVNRLRDLAGEYGVSLKAVALQFCLAHPVSVAVIPGATRPERIAEDVAALAEMIPPELWQVLREEGLIATGAPTPATVGAAA